MMTLLSSTRASVIPTRISKPAVIQSTIDQTSIGATSIVGFNTFDHPS
jgi:hypothetical protein